MSRPDDLRRGAVLMILSSAFFAGMSLMVKLASRGLSSAEVVFYRNVFGLLTLLPFTVGLGLRGLRTSHLPEHLVRGLAGLAAMYCFFYALAHMRLAEAVLLNYSLPLFMPFVEEAWLGVATPRRIWWALGVGFAGLLLILKPGLGLFNPYALFGVASAILAAVAQVGIRRLTHTEPVARIVFYFSALSTFVSALPLLHSPRAPDPALWGILLAMGVLATLAQLLLTRAYAHAPAAQVGPFIYSSVVFAGLIDGWFWGEWPDTLFLAGALLVCAAGILTLRRKVEKTL
jgi:drug/metabolite transporter (DMT)-like permease